METVMGNTCPHQRCPNCFGAFFDMREAENEAASGIRPEHRNADSRFRKTGSKERAIWDARPCPRCEGTTMRELEYSDESGIHIDLCSCCGGIFLDGGELEEMRKYLATSHLPKSVPEFESAPPSSMSGRELDMKNGFSHSEGNVAYAQTTDTDSVPASIRIELKRKLLNDFSPSWGMEFAADIASGMLDEAIELAP